MYSRKRFNSYESKLYQDITGRIEAVETTLAKTCKESRECAKAMTRLDEALMWAGAAIAAGVKPVTKEPEECPADPNDCPLCKIIKDMSNGDVKTVEIRCE